MRKQENELLYSDITRKIIGCAFDVRKELGSGFLETVYEKAMLIALRQAKLSVKAQYPIQVKFRGESIGEYFSDLFVEDKVIVELKAVNTISSEHKAQVLHYLKATGLQVGLLLNFGSHLFQYSRLDLNQTDDSVLETIGRSVALRRE